MKTQYLFPHSYRKIGWILFVPSALIGLYALFFDFHPDFLDVSLPRFLTGGQVLRNNLLDEITGVLTIIGLLFVAFSREKDEDEYIARIRLESLVWAVYINYALLILALLLVYDLDFLWVMVFNMFTVLVIFIIRYQWELYKLKKHAGHEK